MVAEGETVSAEARISMRYVEIMFHVLRTRNMDTSTPKKKNLFQNPLVEAATAMYRVTKSSMPRKKKKRKKKT